jgi:hypothetical protein
MRYSIILLVFLLGACSNVVGDEVVDRVEAEVSCEDPQIKGNLTTHNGEKIYHVPGGQFYDVTDAEEWFCTEEEAEDAGYRESYR